MPESRDTLQCLLELLQHIPRHPQSITVAALRDALARNGFTLTERSIQRHLATLSQTLSITTIDEREKPYRWCWAPSAQGLTIPALSRTAALTLLMAEKHLQGLLPQPMLKELGAYFEAARRALASSSEGPRRWLDRVRIVPPAQPLFAPAIAADVHEAVSKALLDSRQLRIKYQKRGEKSTKDWTIHPLALVQRGPMFYLYCRLFDYPDPRTLALHRIKSAELLDDKVDAPEGFDLDRQIEAGTWGFGAGQQIELDLYFYNKAGDHLIETPLAADQQITEFSNGELRLKARVADTPQLRWWILSIGDGVEVKKPKRLRDQIAETAKATAALYQ
ncbi:hypothetical protein BURK2_02938 [Burkholderiales bacterium]|nr:MAG: WYL domain-containing protein [Burkholderiales bacterium]CAG1000041.1 hypothetical protein BURK2_02938 [Burkholderiales bacterium]